MHWWVLLANGLCKSLGRTAGAAASLTRSQLFRLTDVCRALLAAGRSPLLDRAPSIAAGSTDIPFSPAAPVAYADLLDRESAIARAVDDRYRRLAPSVAADLT